MGKKMTVEELHSMDKDAIILLYLSMQEQLEQLNKNMELLIEQVSLANQRRFGRSSEKMELDGQQNLFFNEAEALIENQYVVEPELLGVITSAKRKKKQPGKREEDLKGLPVETIFHELTEDELKILFADGHKRLPDEVYKRLRFQPATFLVEEHHVAVYADRNNQTVVKADRPADLLRNSIVTPSLEAAIINGKYVNAMPLYRMEQEFSRNDIHISRQVMANWTIRCAERYLSLLYDFLHEELYRSPVLQADETSVEVSKDGRKAGAKSYMWVYRTGKFYESPAIVIYEYQRTRNASHPREFLKGYEGICVTDGYQVYHTLEREFEDLVIAGCWSHARRRFGNVVKAIGKEKAKGTLAYDALKQIGAIYKIEETLARFTPGERQKHRQLSVKPLVDAFFEWIKAKQNEVPPKSETGKGFTYCLNQERYLRVFLEDGRVPADNNATELEIRSFCIGRANWHLIDTIEGAKASAIIYSIVGTAKANQLKPYEYMEHLLTEIPKHMEDTNRNFLKSLLPWAEELPKRCRKI